MNPKIKNILIFTAIIAILILVYVYFIKAPAPEAPLISTSPLPVLGTTTTGNNNFSISQDFLTLLLNVKNIKLDDAILSDKAFASLHDSSITLTPDGNEGRPNPFAPFGIDIVVPGEITLSPSQAIPPAIPAATSPAGTIAP